DPEVVRCDPRLRNARRAAGLEDVDRPAVESLRDPALHRPAAQPLVLKLGEAREIGEAPDLLARIPAGRLPVLDPERPTGRRIEVPVDDFAHRRVECW